MFLDAINANNYFMFNITLAHVIGLQETVYCYELLNIYNKAIVKNKTVDKEFFRLDRNYMYKRTTIPIDKQLEIDSRLEKINLIVKRESDILKIDTGIITSLITGNTKEIIQEVSFQVKPKTRTSKKERILDELKSQIKSDDEDIKSALKDWVDASGRTTGKRKISIQSIKIFQDDMIKYSKGDKKIILDLIKIATIHKYPECGWAITRYENDMRYKKEKSTNNQESYLENIAKEGSLSNKAF